MRIDQIEPHLPECDAVYLADYLWQVGPTVAGGMGPAPLSHCEIAAWQANTGVELSSWEASTLRSLSVAYLNESHEAKKLTQPAPWTAVPKALQRENLARHIKSALRG